MIWREIFTKGCNQTQYNRRILAPIMENKFDNVFIRLKEMLQKYSGAFTVKPDLNDKYGLYAKVGPATLKVWGGKMKTPVMPIAWVEIGKAYVSYHLMGIYMNAKLQASI